MMFIDTSLLDQNSLHNVGEAPLPLVEGLDFTLPAELEATEPPEARGLSRDEVRLMVSYRRDNRVVHSQFREIAQFLEAGDLLVINTSGTLNAALPAIRSDGIRMELHLSTHLPADLWLVELRRPNPAGAATLPFFEAQAGETYQLPGGAQVSLLAAYRSDRQTPVTGHSRLWVAILQLGEPLENYLDRYGFPIRYSYVRQSWPNRYYQTVYATETGSAEMPSAGRAFTPELLTNLIARGIGVAPLVLHTGVASVEDYEPPYEEFYRVPLQTASQVNRAREQGRRVIAVGTTVVRALETVTDTDGQTHPGEGWTHLVITPGRGIKSVDGMLTGLHEPKASHLAMLEALAGLSHLRFTYSEALRERYLWHEFGDIHLILP